MSRIYTQYVNDGRIGCTWAMLAIYTLGALGQPRTVRDIAATIWDRPDPPDSLVAQVQTSLTKLMAAGYAKRSKHPVGHYIYQLTAAAAAKFGKGPGRGWSAANHTDSKLFKPHPVKRKKAA